jgi:hypothetical protein
MVTGYASRGRVLRVAACGKNASGNSASIGQLSFTAGFPFLALEGMIASENSIQLKRAGIWVGPAASKRFLPTGPLWPGFALDTAFYAAIAFTLWSAPGAIRRHRRRARGECPACNYNLSGLPPGSLYPECAASPQ